MEKFTGINTATATFLLRLREVYRCKSGIAIFVCRDLKIRLTVPLKQHWNFTNL